MGSAPFALRAVPPGGRTPAFGRPGGGRPDGGRYHGQDGVKCVIVDPALRKLEPMAYSFVLSFARDNDLVLASLALPGSPATGPEAT